jgi:putative thioredoxin
MQAVFSAYPGKMHAHPARKPPLPSAPDTPYTCWHISIGPSGAAVVAHRWPSRHSIFTAPLMARCEEAAMLNGLSPAPAGKAPVALVKDGSDAGFMADVIEASRTQPVIVDFWASWCGPCKTLGPLLEKAVHAAKGAVRMVKIDIDKNPMIAGQLRVQSIPTVYAFFQGRPVDAFQGAVPESQIKQFIERLAKLGGGAAIGGGSEEMLPQAKAALDGGDLEGASAVYAAILEQEPECAPAYAGIIRCLLAAGQEDDARAMLAECPAGMAKSVEMIAVASQIELLQASKAAGPLEPLRQASARDANDHQARYDYAMALYAAGQREEAVDQLLEIVRRDREWNDKAARTQLLKFFEAFGPTDKLTTMGRRKLSSILFA